MKNDEYIVYKCYQKVLKREPDEFGFKYFLRLLRNNKINEKQIINVLQDSDEYRKIKLANINDRKPVYIFNGLYDIKYAVRPNSAYDDIVVRDGIYDRWICLKLKKLIHKDSTIFDIGANVGLISLPFAKVYVPKGQVYSFEPVGDLVRHMNRNIKINKFHNIKIEQMVLQNNKVIDATTLNRRQAIHDDGLRNDGLSTLERNYEFKIGEEIAKLLLLIDIFQKTIFIN